MAEHNQQFDSHAQWVNFASTWLTRHSDYHHKFFRTICFDTLGRRCQYGRQFREAKEQGTFPIRWWWPDQPISELIVSPDASDDEITPNLLRLALVRLKWITSREEDLQVRKYVMVNIKEAEDILNVILIKISKLEPSPDVSERTDNASK